MSKGRRFNKRERAALYLAADGKCESCGVELEPGWHVDHVRPWSRGGPTDVLNGAALCPPCNLKKGDSMTDPRDRWQRDAVEAFHASTHDFLVTACPGAGKTRMALLAARAAIDSGEVDRVIVVGPTRAVRNQWRTEAARYGLDLTARFENSDRVLPSDVDGVAATYGQVANAPETWRLIASREHRSLVILDEVHHAADDDNSSWGPALLEAFGSARRRLLLSGTPFRTNGTRIPFVQYDDNDICISHRGVSYGKAVQRGFVRPVRFEVMNGSGELLKGDRKIAVSVGDVSDDDQARLLSALYDTDGNWMPSVMRAANNELSRLREEYPRAAGLIVAESRERAQEYARLMTEICGETVPHVVSEHDYDPSEVIAAFRDGSARWIVAVDMISEGVDIPRLATILYASRKKTEMWFRQIVGRCVRRSGDDLTATVFIPMLPVLVEMAERIEEEVRVALVQAERDVRRRMEYEQRQFEFTAAIPLGSSEAVLDRVITSGDVVTEAELRQALAVQAQIGGSLTAAHVADIARALRVVAGHTVATGTVPVPAPATSGDELRTILRKRINELVNRNARDRAIEQKDIHIWLNRSCGDTLPTASVASLEKRLEMLQSWQ